MRRFLGAACVAFCLLGRHAAADVDHAIGGAFSSGAQDVFDFYDEAIPNSEVTGIPVGVSYRSIFQLPAGLRIDLWAGPIVLVFGDVSYLDLPVSGTVGWNFHESGNANPYVRVGVIGHVIDGDLTDDSSASGLLGAVGLEFMKQRKVHIFVEVAHDTSEIEFDDGFGVRKVDALGTLLTVGAVLAF